MRNLREQAATLALVKHADREWHLLAQLLEASGSALRVLRGEWTGFEQPELVDSLGELKIREQELDEYQQLIETLANDGVDLAPVLDDDYPANLRLVFNRPPFLFVRGELSAVDERSIAVVGTRRASDEGKAQATRLASELASSGVTVLS